MRIHFRSSLDHIIFLLTSHTGNSAVILHSNQQTPAICIRERTQRPGDLLTVILISAGLVTLLFKKLKQPVVLGYIVAGILAGPSIEQIPTVTDVESIRIWADIGVIFLLFALGLDFSFKKLMKVGGTAVIGAITVVIGMMTAGYITGLSLGWGHMNSLFLGGMLSMSSTTIIFKAFDDMGLRNQRFAGVVFGILVVEALFAV